LINTLESAFYEGNSTSAAATIWNETVVGSTNGYQSGYGYFNQTTFQ